MCSYNNTPGPRPKILSIQYSAHRNYTTLSGAGWTIISRLRASFLFPSTFRQCNNLFDPQPRFLESIYTTHPNSTQPGLRYTSTSPSWTRVKASKATRLLFWQGCSVKALQGQCPLLDQHGRHRVVGLVRPHLRRVPIAHNLCREVGGELQLWGWFRLFIPSSYKIEL